MSFLWGDSDVQEEGTEVSIAPGRLELATY